LGEAVLNNLQTIGIRSRLRPLERAAFFKGYSEKKFKNIIQGQSGAFGNAATRAEVFAVSGGAYAYGGYPEIDALFAQQTAELDRYKREVILRKLQQLVWEKAMYSPIWQLAFLSGVGPRSGESGFGLISGYPYTAPYEDMTLKAA
jgi:peptide/nickel transport system substrate-binding protein